MPNFTIDDLVQGLIQRGITDTATLARAVALAISESIRGSTSPVGIQNSSGAPAYGPWQVYTPAHPDFDLSRVNDLNYQLDYVVSKWFANKDFSGWYYQGSPYLANDPAAPGSPFYNRAMEAVRRIQNGDTSQLSYFAGSSNGPVPISRASANVGPNGRTFSDITGTEYLSDEERAWYLGQLGFDIGPDGKPVKRAYAGGRYGAPIRELETPLSGNITPPDFSSDAAGSAGLADQNSGIVASIQQFISNIFNPTLPSGQQNPGFFSPEASRARNEIAQGQYSSNLAYQQASAGATQARLMADQIALQMQMAPQGIQALDTGMFYQQGGSGGYGGGGGGAIEMGLGGAGLPPTAFIPQTATPAAPVWSSPENLLPGQIGTVRANPPEQRANVIDWSRTPSGADLKNPDIYRAQ